MASADSTGDHFRPLDPSADRGGPDFPRLIDAIRDLLDGLAVSDPPPPVTARLADAVQAAARELTAHGVELGAQPAGTRFDLPGRGHPLQPPWVVDEADDGRVRGRVTFRPQHRGGTHAVHGGILPMLFDEILGRLQNSFRFDDGGVLRGGLDRPLARTAYLHVDYRAVTPVGVELRFEARVVRQEGRKSWATAELYDGVTLLAEAEGLFVVLQPG